MTTAADPRSGGPLRHLSDELRDLEKRSLLRIPPSATAAARPEQSAGSRPPLVLCSNDYLGYAADPWDAALSPGDSGAGASRLVSGEHPAHAEAEAEIARWLGAEASLLFSSGYAANVGVIAALARPGDVIVSDALNHASIIDGCRLSGAHIRVTPHHDTAAVGRALVEHRSARRRWVVTESYFSMDGDCPDLPALRALCDEHDAALYVDEAHALGVFGERGRGLCAESGVRPDVLIGTFGKALGLQGAFVAGSEVLRTYLWNRARSFVFSTGVSPSLAAQIRANVQRAAADDRGRERLHETARRLREGLRAMGATLGPSERGPVLPWLIGSSGEAVAISGRLRAEGVIVQAIRPPTVPAGTARLRVTATARLSELDVERAIAAFGRAMGVRGGL
jgi:8-amino-7-oxononanoate synthase